MSPIKDSMFGGADGGAKEDETKPEAPAKRGRRTKAQLVADARVPGNEEIVEVKFTATKTSGEREWLVAVELFREGKIEFVDKTLKYAVLKMDEQREAAAGEGGVSGEVGEKIAGLTAQWLDVQKRLDAATADDEIRQLSEESEKVREEIGKLGGEDPQSDESHAKRNAGSLTGKRTEEFVPENAMTGDEIIHGTKADKTEETYFVGHGHVLVREPPTQDDKLVEAGARWFKHEGEWRSVLLEDGNEVEPKPDEAPAQVKQSAFGPPKAAEGAAAVSTGPEVIEQTVEPIAIGGFNTALWKVSMGYLEKIGLPDYSSLQVGPSSAQAHVLDDGRRTKVEMHGREVTIPTAVVEQMQMCAQVCEYVMRAERQAMINFLEAVKPGSTAPQS